MWGSISVGPVAQFKPKEKTGKGAMVAHTALMSVPTSMVPCCSKVTDASTGKSVPVFSRRSKQAISTVFICNRS